ncbi:MAG: hypothetical protein KME31_09835 [Tolypothrix carrinoi HA7290-LM1]|nr:hypothetical protein [Tolypothrix carrinoi HA7290-LM1]
MLFHTLLSNLRQHLDYSKLLLGAGFLAIAPLKDVSASEVALQISQHNTSIIPSFFWGHQKERSPLITYGCCLTLPNRGYDKTAQETSLLGQNRKHDD